MKNKKIVIVGAGPAGLTAAAEFLKNKKFEVDILEKDSVVGGLSKTTEYNGCKFDIGPHHFITSAQEIDDYWTDLMKDEQDGENDFTKLNRFTRIYYKKKYFHYPLQAFNVIKNLSFTECVKCVFSYIKIALFPIKKVKTFQDWVTNKFGFRLFSIFFKTYTEKLWGISCTKISADWASQRIKGFSLSKAIFYAFFGKWFKKNAPRTLSDEFRYPQMGAGTLWQKLADSFSKNKNSKIVLDEEVVGITHKNNRIKLVSTRSSKLPKGVTQKLKEYEVDYFLSTMPLKSLILSMDPLPEHQVVKAARKLTYRGLVTVNFIVNKKDICPDHWLYIHEKEVDMVRVGNMNNFSSKMVNNENYTALSLEYFTFEKSGFWQKSDTKLINIGKKELVKLGLVKESEVLDGMVLRVPEAYPLYDQNYKEYLNVVLNYLSKFPNLQLMGRNGQHRYNNMDIAMISAMDAVDKILEREKEIEKLKQQNSGEKIKEQRPVI